LTDEKGRKVLIPAAQIAYVDLGSEHTPRGRVRRRQQLSYDWAGTHGFVRPRR
jgi:hypothetical protein